MKTVKQQFDKICSYQGSNFKEWFGGTPFDETIENIRLTKKKLPRYMNDKEIISELKPGEVSIEEVYDTLVKMKHDVWALFYVKDSAGVLRTVRVYWHDGGWSVGAYSVGGPYGWVAGLQVFSRNFGNSGPQSTLTLGNSDTMPLRLTINGIKYIRE